MKNHYRKCIAAACGLTAMLLNAAPVSAHFPWLNLSDYTPDKGAKIKGTVGWGHSYPLDGFLEVEELEAITVMGPAGKAREVIFPSALEWESEEGVTDEGGYVVAAERKPGFYTKTSKGGKRASKKGLDGVTSCSYSHTSMKAVAGQGAAGDVAHISGLPMEIVPLDNPAALKTGDYLHVRVLLHGKPYRGEILGTYAGFSTDSNTYAYATSTDAEGYGRIRILQPGLWLLKTTFASDYPDPEECDVEKYSTTLTLAVQ